MSVKGFCKQAIPRIRQRALDAGEFRFGVFKKRLQEWIKESFKLLVVRMNLAKLLQSLEIVSKGYCLVIQQRSRDVLIRRGESNPLRDSFRVYSGSRWRRRGDRISPCFRCMRRYHALPRGGRPSAKELHRHKGEPCKNEETQNK